MLQFLCHVLQLIWLQLACLFATNRYASYGANCHIYMPCVNISMIPTPHMPCVTTHDSFPHMGSFLWCQMSRLYGFQSQDLVPSVTPPCPIRSMSIAPCFTILCVCHGLYGPTLTTTMVLCVQGTLLVLNFTILWHHMASFIWGYMSCFLLVNL